jgi:hypothetical protein
VPCPLRKTSMCPLSPHCTTNDESATGVFSLVKALLPTPSAKRDAFFKTRHLPPTEFQECNCWNEALLITAFALALASASATPLIPRLPVNLDESISLSSARPPQKKAWYHPLADVTAASCQFLRP